MKPDLRVHQPKNEEKLKVVNPHFDTICECIPTPLYASNYKTRINEMVCAWNETFAKGLDPKAPLPISHSSFVVPKRQYWLADDQCFKTFEEVEVYAARMGLRVVLTETAYLSNIYRVTLIK